MHISKALKKRQEFIKVSEVFYMAITPYFILLVRNADQSLFPYIPEPGVRNTATEKTSCIQFSIALAVIKKKKRLFGQMKMLH